MAIQVRWYDESRQIILMHYQADWDWSAFHLAFERTGTLLSEVEHKVSIIHLVDTFPGGTSLLHLRSKMVDPPANLNRAVVVPNGNTVTNRMIEVMIDMASRMFGQKMPLRVMRSLSEAAAYLQQQV